MTLLIEFLLRRRMIDWEVFQIAVALLFGGHNPYAFGGDGRAFYNPAYTAVVVAPLVWLPAAWQPFALALAALLSAAYVARRLRYGVMSQALVLSAPALWYAIGYGNIDWLVWLGLALPAPIGLLLLGMKPQATLLAMAVIVLRQDGWRRRLLAVLPLGILWGASLAIYGWRLPSARMLAVEWWPYGLLLGVPLAGLALWKRSLRAAIVAMPFCTPYLSLYSFMGLSFAYPLAGWLAQAAMFVWAFVKAGWL